MYTTDVYKMYTTFQHVLPHYHILLYTFCMQNKRTMAAKFGIQNVYRHFA